MVIKLKNSFKKYFSKLWLIELILILILTFINVDIVIKYVGSADTKDGIGALEAVLNTKDFYKNMLREDSKYLSEDIYLKTDSLSKLLFSTDLQKQAIRNMIYSDSFYSKKDDDNYKLPKDVYFVIRNKYTDEIFTNDPFFQGVNKLKVENLYEVIKEKHNGANIITQSFNNVNLYNKGVEDGNITYSAAVLKEFEEIYYAPESAFKNYVQDAIGKLLLFSISVIINLFLLIKLIVIIVRQKGNIEISGNFIGDVVYIFKHAFKYRGPRRTLITSIILSIIFYIIYLYLLAIGGNDNNIIVNFFRLYPFKGSFLLVALPMVGVMYSVKRNIEIGMVKDSLKKINDGDFEKSVKEMGGVEIRELIKNINKMKDGYSIAIDEALQNEKLKTELISNVSHDLKTPLTSIINYVNILGDDRILEEERKEYLDIVAKKANKLKVLIEDLFEVSKINSGKIQLNKQKIDIVSLVYQVIGEYSAIYEDKNIEFKVDSEEDEIIMDLDGMMISRVIENIVINALKYSLENTRVYVVIEKNESGAVISFKNVANYEMDFEESEMFERFARADKSRNSTIEGSGLGLAITKSIVELHGGETRIKREGDLFKIYIFLPIEEEKDIKLNKKEEKSVKNKEQIKNKDERDSNK